MLGESAWALTKVGIAELSLLSCFMFQGARFVKVSCFVGRWNSGLPVFLVASLWLGVTYGNLSFLVSVASQNCEKLTPTYVLGTFLPLSWFCGAVVDPWSRYSCSRVEAFLEGEPSSSCPSAVWTYMGSITASGSPRIALEISIAGSFGFSLYSWLKNYYCPKLVVLPYIYTNWFLSCSFRSVRTYFGPRPAVATFAGLKIGRF